MKENMILSKSEAEAYERWQRHQNEDASLAYAIETVAGGLVLALMGAIWAFV